MSAVTLSPDNSTTTKQALTIDLTLDQAKAVIAIHALISDPKGGILQMFLQRFCDQIMRRFHEQHYGRLINAWDSLVLQAQLRCKEPREFDHTARLRHDLAQITGCTCGWRMPSSVTDSDTALTEHLAIARAAEGAQP